jgi:hypothetical protein
MLVMVAGITRKERGTIPRDLIKDIEKLGTCVFSAVGQIIRPCAHLTAYRDLEEIKQDLDKIATQSWFLIALFKAANKAKVDRCTVLLKNSLTHWQVRHHMFAFLLSLCNAQFRWPETSLVVLSFTRYSRE